MSSIAARITPAENVRFERLLPGPIERVWEYLTKPDLQRAWLAESAADICDITALPATAQAGVFHARLLRGFI